MRFGLSSIVARRAAGRAESSAIDTLAGRLLAYEECLRRLPQWVHAGWQQDLGLPASIPGHPSLPAALGVDLIPAHVFEQPVNGLALLAPAGLCRVLRARALLRRRPALRRCVEPRLRRSMNNWLHPVVFDAVLLESPDDGLHHDVEGMPWPPGAAAQDAPDALAWEGFCLFRQDAAWTVPQVLRLIRLRFAPDAVVPADLMERPGAVDGSRWVMERVARFLPEAPWLYG